MNAMAFFLLLRKRNEKSFWNRRRLDILCSWKKIIFISFFFSAKMFYPKKRNEKGKKWLKFLLKFVLIERISNRKCQLEVFVVDFLFDSLSKINFKLRENWWCFYDKHLGFNLPKETICFWLEREATEIESNKFETRKTASRCRQC